MESTKQQPLNGKFWDWVNRNKKAILTVLKFAASKVGIPPQAIDVGFEVAKEMSYEAPSDSEIGPGVDTSLSGVVNYEPTAQEDSILKNFLQQKLAVINAKILYDIDNLLKINDFDTQLSVLESLVNKTEIIKQFYATNESEGLSPNAIVLRNQLINYVFEVIDGTIEIISRNNGVVFKKQVYRKILKQLPQDFEPIVLIPNRFNTRKRFVFYLSKLNVIDKANTVTKSLYE